jgi:hypothetical protein
MNETLTQRLARLLGEVYEAWTPEHDLECVGEPCVCGTTDLIAEVEAALRDAAKEAES